MSRHGISLPKKFTEPDTLKKRGQISLLIFSRQVDFHFDLKEDGKNQKRSTSCSNYIVSSQKGRKITLFFSII